MAINYHQESCAQALQPQKSLSPSASFVRVAAVLLLNSILFGCATSKESEKRLAEVSLENTILHEKNQQLSGELTEHKKIAARLQMALVEKQVEINAAKSVMERSPDRGTEHVQVRVPPPNSKAEAVICLAEVETEINAVRESSAAGKQSQDFSKVDDLLARSRDILAQENYDEACILANQALSEARTTRTPPAQAKRVTPIIYTDFIQPLQLLTKKSCHIRMSPKIGSRILETLASDTPVKAIGYQGNWIKVTTNNEASGWIYYNLLTVPNAEYYGKSLEADSIRERHL
jgi:hypothetical protein